MRIAFFSDIHGNIEALDACLADLTAQGGADRIIGVGDYCMDGPWPRAVLERLREHAADCIRGNTDRFIGTPCAPKIDDEPVLWQRRQLGETWTTWLRDLPFSLSIGAGVHAMRIVHANPKSDDVHVWPDASDIFLEDVLNGVDERVIVFGHLHLPYVRMWRDRLLVNVASVGLPKDGDSRAGYVIATERSGGWEIKHRRVVYDIARVVRDIETSGMPEKKKRVRVLLRHRYKELHDRIP